MLSFWSLGSKFCLTLTTILKVQCRLNSFIMMLADANVSCLISKSFFMHYRATVTLLDYENTWHIFTGYWHLVITSPDLSKVKV